MLGSLILRLWLLGVPEQHRDLGYLSTSLCVGGARRGYRVGWGTVLATLGAPQALQPTLKR